MQWACDVLLNISLGVRSAELPFCFDDGYLMIEADDLDHVMTVLTQACASVGLDLNLAKLKIWAPDVERYTGRGKIPRRRSEPTTRTRWWLWVGS